MSQAAKKITVPDVMKAKELGQRLVMITAYDATMGRLVDEAGVDMVLVGDTLAMVVLGYESTLPVTMDEMLHHTRAVRRGVKRALVIGDMPFGSFQGSVSDAVRHASRFLKEAGADAIKLEGGRSVAPRVRQMTEMGIPVLGHIGLMPQSVRQIGGYKVQGRDPQAREALLKDAQALEEAGAFAIVLECIPEALGAEITQAVSIPTIGIGAGRYCNGQVLVVNDMLGLVADHKPKFVKRYTDLTTATIDAVKTYCDEVRSGVYPGEEHRYE